jgi:ABC-type microcin C transport system permease subunit YejE
VNANYYKEVKQMKISFFPKSKSGTWSVSLFLLLVLLVAFFFLMVNVFDQRGGDTLFSN